jgi:hypothetical protein
MIDPFSRTRYHPDLKLETWYPEGIMDGAMADRMVNFIGFEERIIDEPFNRFADLSGLKAIHLDLLELGDLAAKRCGAYKDPHPVKTAFVATTASTYAVAQMFAILMEPSPIDVRVFRNVEEAAYWLGVPVKALHAEE